MQSKQYLPMDTHGEIFCHLDHYVGRGYDPAEQVG